ncbi:hypothetical protein [Auraticoccus monumenti]|uniref:Uncharacterized protein n=1 Tax=Auraticoccus monumenti TaxID=675864 RepID=A0A1G6ZWI2_9ACTN|nr:hypothetical protein [Auraticoccus monumenti]SDE06932.1 hypothetical protein SAMN04489747_2426 [Auraticoccus monumenti]
MNAIVDDAMQRLRRVMNDPEVYSAEARRESEQVVRAEMAREKRSRSGRVGKGTNAA